MRTPFEIALGGARCRIEEIYRLLPGKRLAARGRFKGREVLVKLFVGWGARRRCRRERRGLALLRASGVRAPQLLREAPIPQPQGWALLFEFLPQARPIALEPPAQAEVEAARASQALARLHECGAVHRDPHRGNFLISGGQLYLVDGDSLCKGATPLGLLRLGQAGSRQRGAATHKGKTGEGEGPSQDVQSPGALAGGSVVGTGEGEGPSHDAQSPGASAGGSTAGAEEREGPSRDVQGGAPLGKRRSLRALADFLAQYPPAADVRLAALLECYARERGWAPDAARRSRLENFLRLARHRRLRRHLGKTRRDCTEFHCQRSWRRACLAKRDCWNGALQAFAADPETGLAGAKIVEQGNGPTLFRLVIGGERALVKRYGPGAAGRWSGWRLHSPARAAWRDGHRLHFLEPEIPPPIALIEQRWGPLHGQSYLVMPEPCSRRPMDWRAGRLDGP